MSNIYEDYYNLQQRHKRCQQAIKDALGYIYCIGGPLNDNVLNYTDRQLMPFVKISNTLKNVEDCND